MYEEENIEPEFMKRGKTNQFRTPDRYFDSIEDRIMEEIKLTTKKRSFSGKVLQLLKPVLALAASFTLIYILVHYPINHFLPGVSENSNIAVSDSASMVDDSTLNFSSIDENTLVNAIFSDKKSNISQINQDDMLAYLSSGLNEVEIYSEIQN